MYIIVTGSPWSGFAVVGPYASEEAASDGGDWARIEHGGGAQNDWWAFKLNDLLEDPHVEEEDSCGTAVVFAGSIVDDWGFYGPFRDIEAARKWAAEDGLGRDCAIELMPVEELETA
jgi:hypothetical protein